MLLHNIYYLGTIISIVSFSLFWNIVGGGAYEKYKLEDELTKIGGEGGS